MKEEGGAPFTAAQVESLNAFQAAGVMHPFTCGGGGGPCSGVALVAAADGWHCPSCKTYTQDWAHPFMLDWSWKRAWDAMWGRPTEPTEGAGP